MQQQAPEGQQEVLDEQQLCFQFSVGTRDPKPAKNYAFCLAHGRRETSKGGFRAATVVVDENGDIDVLASGACVTSHVAKPVLDGLLAYKNTISELQQGCGPSEAVYPKLSCVLGKYRTAICTAVYQVSDAVA